MIDIICEFGIALSLQVLTVRGLIWFAESKAVGWAVLAWGIVGLCAAVALSISDFASAAPAPNYPWTEIYREQCLPVMEQKHGALGEWIYDVARCTASLYPPTQVAPHSAVKRCVDKVKAQTRPLCQQCNGNRVDAVMLCLTGP